MAPLGKAFLLLLFWSLCADAVRPSITDDLEFMAEKKAERGQKLNLRPIIGVVSQYGDPSPKGHTYIASSYIKFLEGAGARVIPILADMPPKEVKRRFDAVNGLLVPGGSQDLTPGHPFYDVVTQLFDLTLKANDRGDFIPLHGTCLGFETLAVIASKNHSILSDFDAENLPSPLFPTDKAEASAFFASLPRVVYDNLIKKPYAMENHVNGLAWTAIAENPALVDFFNVLTLSVDRVGRAYVSTMEAIKYPITATQWHPEKNAYEWTLDKEIPHDPAAVEVTQEVGNYLVSQARRNHHRVVDQLDELDMLIYNYKVFFTGRAKFKGEEVDFDESYFFPPWPEVEAELDRKRADRAAAARR